VLQATKKSWMSSFHRGCTLKKQSKEWICIRVQKWSQNLFSPWNEHWNFLLMIPGSMSPWQSPVVNIIWMIKSRMRWAGHVAWRGAKRNACRILVGKSEGKRPLGRWRYRWVDNVKMDLRQDGVVWTGSIWFMIGTSSCEHSNEPLGSIKCWEVFE
jgi:hypothetical protein